MSTIILEGPDNSGKSTLGKILNQYTNCQVIHAAGPPKTHEEKEKGFKDQLNWAKQSVILDRITAISNQVYQGFMFSPIHLIHLTRMILNGASVVYCRPSINHLMKKLQFRDEESEEFRQNIIDNQHVFINNYDELMTYVPHINYNFEDLAESSELQKMLIKHLTEGQPPSMDNLRRMFTKEYSSWKSLNSNMSFESFLHDVGLMPPTKYHNPFWSSFKAERIQSE